MDFCNNNNKLSRNAQSLARLNFYCIHELDLSSHILSSNEGNNIKEKSFTDSAPWSSPIQLKEGLFCKVFTHSYPNVSISSSSSKRKVTLELETQDWVGNLLHIPQVTHSNHPAGGCLSPRGKRKCNGSLSVETDGNARGEPAAFSTQTRCVEPWLSSCSKKLEEKDTSEKCLEINVGV